MTTTSRLQSPGLKMIVLALLQLLLLVPLLQVDGLVQERSGRMHEAESSIGAQWGRAQRLAPALLVVDLPSVDAQGQRIPERDQVLLPDSVTVLGELQPEWRHRGIYAIPVYATELAVTARFAAADLEALRHAAGGKPLRPRLQLGLSDARGVRALSALRVGERDYVAESAGRALADLELLASPIDEPDGRGDLVLTYKMTVAGSDRLELIPLGRDTRFELSGAWPDPDFSGAFLPATRTIEDGGFKARWQVLGFNRSLPQRFWLDASPARELEASAFGVKLYRANDIYQQNARAGKYGVLISALVFLALFLFETIARLSLHPIQYGFIGLALALFYLLLIAFSEHFGFTGAYLVASVSATLLVTGYARAALGSTARAMLLGALQAGAYAVFYVLVQSDDYALVLGATTLFGVLAIAMYLTRRVDWYALSDRQKTEPAG